MSEPSRDEPYRDQSLPLADRVSDLVSRLTLDEKVALLHQYQAPVPRLGVGKFRTGTEALHGLAWLGPATVFPQAVGLASTWDPELVRRVGAAVGDEVRGFHHKDPERAGLNVWAPVVNPLRDPRWGRNEEGYAEDPWLTGVMGTAYASGLRGDHPRYLKTAPTVKHFLGYNNETNRCTTSSNLPPRVLHEYELPAFRAPIAAGAAVAVMASYNLVNGRPAHVSPLIGDELRRWSADELLVVGDALAGNNIAAAQGYYPDHVAGFAAALRAGVDCFTEDDADSGPTVERLTRALERGLLDESHVDAAVRHILSVRFRLGEFDRAEGNPYAGITAEVINCTAHQRLAYEAARESIVLLKNECGPILPLDAATVGRVAVLGPLADTLYEDWYSGTLPYSVTARSAIAERLGAAAYHEGIDRVALRGPSGYVIAAESTDGGPLRADATARPADAAFDLLDWGQHVVALRAVANGRHVGVDDGGALVNDQPGPNGWEVRQTFRLVDHDGGIALHHLATGHHVRVGDDGTLRADAVELADATAFTMEVLIDGAQEAAAVAAEADVAVVVVGNHPLVNGRETEDRADLDLPPGQDALIRAVYAANPRTIVVVSSSYPYAIGWADTQVPAVLWSAHGGQEYGHALADVLFGADADGRPVDPAGRLTQTWYHSDADLPDLLDYDVIATDATYLYFRGTPLYPFGHGLSYTSFDYRDLRLSATAVDADGVVEVSVEVVNTGDRHGEHVVQLYTRQQHSRVKQPLRALRGFARVSLAPGESTTVRLPLRAADLASWDVTRGRMVVESARHTVLVGGSSADIALTAALTVHGERIGPRDAFAGPLRAVDGDDYAGIILVDETLERGDAVAATAAGGWIVFEGVDFGGGASAVRAAVSSAGATTLVLRLDDPLTGPIAATLAVPDTGVPVPEDAVTGGAPATGAAPRTPAQGGRRWAEVRGPVTADGVRDLYLLFGSEGTAAAWLAFDPARTPAAGDEERG